MHTPTRHLNAPLSAFLASSTLDFLSVPVFFLLQRAPLPTRPACWRTRTSFPPPTENKHISKHPSFSFFGGTRPCLSVCERWKVQSKRHKPSAVRHSHSICKWQGTSRELKIAARKGLSATAGSTGAALRSSHSLARPANIVCCCQAKE